MTCGSCRRYRFEALSLTTKEGAEVKKTAKGDAFCKAPLRDLSVGGTVILNPQLLEDFDKPFDVRDCFKIKKAGTYILTVKARLYSMKSYNEFIKLDIPEASLKLVLRESDLEER